MGGSYTVVNAETTTLLAAMSVQPDQRRTAIIDTFIGALKAAGVWSKIDAMWVAAAHDEQAGRLNWKSPGSFTLTAVNTPTFTTDRGFNGNGSTSYLDTGWDRSTDGVQYTRDDAHGSLYQLTHGGNQVPTFADNQAGPRFAVGARSDAVGGAGGNTVNSATVVSQNTTGSMTPNHTLVRRNNSTQQSIVRDGVEVLAPAAANSQALGTADLVFNKYGSNYNSSRWAGGSVGAYLDDTEALAFYNAWYAYMVAVGADT